MDIMRVIDEILVPAQRDGRVHFTNGAQWYIKTAGITNKCVFVDISGEPVVAEVDSAEYARQWGMPFPLPTREANVNATNWLRPRLAV